MAVRTAALRAGRTWHYQDGFLLNQFLGRSGHTPAWIVEVEGSSFHGPEPGGALESLANYFKTPRIVRRHQRRLVFAWPLRWPPPDKDEREQLVALAVETARRMGLPLQTGCGVCGRLWEGGPTFMEERARHLCPDCAGEIERAQSESPSGPLSTWLWCGVAGFAGLLLQILFHWSLGWSVVPLAVVAGWLMGSANGPNFDRHPVATPAATLILVFLFQTLGLTMLAATQFGFYQFSEWTRLFFWTARSLPANLVAGCLAGAAGLSLAWFERRLKKI